MIDEKQKIEDFLDADEKKDQLRILTAGSVDDGKSTLIGRLLFDSKKIYDDQFKELVRDSKRLGNAGNDNIDFALLLDGLKAEREEGITIDVAYRFFSTNRRKFIIADTPGHEQYTRNMITGGSTANLAIILVDARNGVNIQTKRHLFLLSILGIKHVIIAVNKMDLMQYDKDCFDHIVFNCKHFIELLHITDLNCIPLSALKGDNVVYVSSNMPWYRGKSLLNLLETISIEDEHNWNDFRFPVQYVLRPNMNFRGYCGKVVSGIIHKGDEILILPSQKHTYVKSIVTYDGNLDDAFPSQSVTLTLADELDISRGDMLVKPDNIPTIDRSFEAILVWMDEEPLNFGKLFFIKHTTNMSRVRINRIQYKIDVNTMTHQDKDAGSMCLNQIARVTFISSKPLFFDPYNRNRSTGSFIIIDPITNKTSAVGMIIGSVPTTEIIHSSAMPTLNLMELSIPEEQKGIVDKIVKELGRQGISVMVE
ncbi:MAG: sulfate adenylyltransferase subunit CysN [Phocaeicola sp.]|uniref:sulfate adenylyltransferase subunit CysN n=1 Tax=Phocaeicola sp. TaxID=2773926 RepID=UPI003FA15F0D